MWFSPRSVGLHVILVVLTPTFILLFLWQVRRATSGNTLSWAYVFEWPFFLAYAVYMWWRLVHEPTAELPDAAPGAAAGRPAHPERVAAGGAPGRAEEDAAGTSEEDRDLAAYNRYLAELDASGHKKHW